MLQHKPREITLEERVRWLEARVLLLENKVRREQERRGVADPGRTFRDTVISMLMKTGGKRQ